MHAVQEPSRSHRTYQLGTSLEVFLRPEDAERFIEEVRSDDKKLARSLRLVERELEAAN